MVLSAGMSEPVDDNDAIGQWLDNAARIAGMRLPSDLKIDSEDDQWKQIDLLNALFDYQETFRRHVWKVIGTFTASAFEPARAASEKKQKSLEANRFARISKNVQALLGELDDGDTIEALYETYLEAGPTTEDLEDLISDLNLLGRAAQDT